MTSPSVHAHKNFFVSRVDGRQFLSGHIDELGRHAARDHRIGMVLRDKLVIARFDLGVGRHWGGVKDIVRVVHLAFKMPAVDGQEFPIAKVELFGDRGKEPLFCGMQPAAGNGDVE
jgi:hypothetical protein